MGKIKDLYRLDIDKTIDKVVTFGNTDKLKEEAAQYVVTDKLKNSYEKVLDAFHTGMANGSSEVGIWVSGFYGSGKSSFSKYLGLSIDKTISVDGQSFQERLSNRINSTPISQLMKTIMTNHDPLVFLIDLATKSIKSFELAPVSDVIYSEVMNWAGYAREKKVALLERKLEMDGKLDEFKNRVKSEKGKEWDEAKKDPMVAKAISQDLAPQFYSDLWRDERAFNVMRIEELESEKEQIVKMIDLIRMKSGKENIIFIVDEVGQYVSAKEELITKLQGTMEVLKDTFNGKVWLLATAQQTLTEDNPKARFNSDKLFKLKDRFPVPVEVEASDIKEIIIQRLLGKSADGKKELEKLYKQHGQQLRQHTKLTNVDRTHYKEDLDERSFVDLYPYHPHHFAIILNLLAVLSKRTGGVGLRSAIRVIQDVLKEQKLAEEGVGALATTSHIYDVMKSDILKTFGHVEGAVKKVEEVFGPKDYVTQVAKSIGVLQLLEDLHLSVENLAALMHSDVAKGSCLDQVKIAVEEMKKSPGIPLQEVDGKLRFMSDQILLIEVEKSKIHVSGQDSRKVLEEQLEDLFQPTPRARLLNTKTVNSGIQLNVEDRTYKLLGSNEEIQTEIFFAPAQNYSQKADTMRMSSTEAINKNKLFLLGSLDEDLTAQLEEIKRCEGIYETRNKYTDREVNDYLKSQSQEARKQRDNIRHKLKKALEKGEFIFRGTTTPLKTLAPELKEAANKQIKTVAETVFAKYEQAPESVPSDQAKKLLGYDNLQQYPAASNVFDLIKGDGGIVTDIPSEMSIKEFLQKEGQIEGKRLLDFFFASPYGWNKDTTRYICTVLFLASELKLRIGGEDITVKGPKAVDALSSNQNFGKIAISLHDGERPSLAQLKLAATRVTELTGQNVVPLEQKISEVVNKHFPRFQSEYAPLRKTLEYLSLPGLERADEIRNGLEEILKGDASDAAFRLGNDESELYDNLVWAREVMKELENGIESTIQEIRKVEEEINGLPSQG